MLFIPPSMTNNLENFLTRQNLANVVPGNKWELPDSGTASVSSVLTTSNVGSSGIFAYELDMSDPKKFILGEPDVQLCRLDDNTLPMSGKGILFGTENGDTKIALDAAEFSAQLNLTKSFQVSTQSVNTLCVSINGFVMIPCNPGGTDSPAKPPDFYNLNESVVIAPAILNNQAENIISSDSNAYNVFYRELNSTDYSEVDSVINDTRFGTSWGFVATWYKVGDLVNNYTLTNSFQVC